MTGKNNFWCNGWCIYIYSNNTWEFNNQVFLRNELIVYPYNSYYTWYHLSYSCSIQKRYTLKKCGSIMFLCIKCTPYFWSKKWVLNTIFVNYMLSFYYNSFSYNTQNPHLLTCDWRMMLNWHLMYTCTKYPMWQFEMLSEISEQFPRWSNWDKKHHLRKCEQFSVINI